MKIEQTQTLSADTIAWRTQVKAEFHGACRTLRSRPGVPSVEWIVDAVVDRAMRYAIEDKTPEDDE